MLLGSAGFRGVTRNWEQIPAGSPSCVVVQPNSANTPVNYYRRGRRAILILAIFLIARMYLKIQNYNVLSKLASPENLPEMQIPAPHLLLTESGIQRMGSIGYNTGGCPPGCPMLEFSALYLLLYITTKKQLCLVNLISNFSSRNYFIKTYFCIKRDNQIWKHSVNLQ